MVLQGVISELGRECRHSGSSDCQWKLTKDSFDRSFPERTVSRNIFNDVVESGRGCIRSPGHVADDYNLLQELIELSDEIVIHGKTFLGTYE
jgi:hypothetical protein